ncbi:MAG: hypothetical protein QXV17_03660 [Candidatus Micrarchaeaceae archaeon]
MFNYIRRVFGRKITVTQKKPTDGEVLATIGGQGRHITYIVGTNRWESDQK